jgi:hypothetical protein
MRLESTIIGAFASLLLLCAAMPLPARPQQESEAVCPLTEDQSKKSVEAFAALAPIFREPRCKNCHGVVSPFFNPESHRADPPIEQGTDCENCHDILPGWSLAPTSMSFVDKSDEELCEMMREHFDRATGAPSFMGHMTNDNGGPQFIETAMAGNKGMEEPDYGIEKPPGWDHPKLIRLSKAWVDAMGGRFHGDNSCGCKLQHYALRLDYKVLVNLQGLAVVSGEYQTQTISQNSNSLDVPLEAKAPGYFEGEATMTLKGHGQVNAPFGTCTGQAQHSFLVRATARLDEGSEESKGRANRLHVKMDCSQLHTSSSGSCPYVGGSEDRFSPCQADVDVDFAPADLDKSQIKEFPMPLPGSQATLDSSIVKRD